MTLCFFRYICTGNERGVNSYTRGVRVELEEMNECDIISYECMCMLL